MAYGISRVVRGGDIHITGWKVGDSCHILANKSFALPGLQITN